jgi:hypothetical protein
LKRLVLHLQGYLQKNNVTEFCNKLGVFCYIVTQGKIIVVPTESYKVITFADFCPLGRPEALPHSRTRTRALALPHRLTTMTFSKRTLDAHAWKNFGKNFGRKKATLRWLVETLGFSRCIG